MPLAKINNQIKIINYIKSIEKLKEDVKTKKKGESGEVHSSLKPSVGYGGKYGVQQDRVDKVDKAY